MNRKNNTPMMEQYLSIKESHKDSILFYRMGDFYEMFYEDALKASAILEITLTSRNRSEENPVPMCGVPCKAADTYIARLIEKGLKVAVCEQTEDASAAKGLVKREVVRVITPGMILNESLLDKGSNNFLLALSKTREAVGIAYLDISTGTFRTTQIDTNQAGTKNARISSVLSPALPPVLIDEVLKVDPSEILLPGYFENDPVYKSLHQAFEGKQISYLNKVDFEWEEAKERLLKKFNIRSLEGFGIEDMEASISAAGAILSYIQDTQRTEGEHIVQIKPYSLNDFLIIDDRSCKNLELLANIRTLDKKGSLIHILDKTVTAMGSRLLRNWIRYPLTDPEDIYPRLDAIEELTQASHIHQLIIQHLKSVYDLERLGSKISMGQGNARDMIALKLSLQKLPLLFKELGVLQNELINGKLLKDRENLLYKLESLAALIEKAIREDAPNILNEGGLIKDGFNSELDALLSLARDGKSWIAKTEAAEKEKTGLSSLKIKYNKVFGYFIEVSKVQAKSVPEHYIRKQTLVNAERFITEEMKEVESNILNAQEKCSALEYDIFLEIRAKITHEAAIILKAAEFIAVVDVLQGLALAASENGYCKPLISKDNSLIIEKGRHPVVEKMIKGERFVHNSICMDSEEQQVLLITGPNMAGKSTILRQVALTVLMGQMGSFVPASKAVLPIVDRIFTRVGALDNLSAGQSTFMVEMEETANILNNATPQSLVILDEIGRGTSTYDGMSIAWAVAEYLHDLDGKGVKTLFATHYHELIQLEDLKPRLKNYNIAVKEFDNNIIFLRKLVKGGTNKSYGIQVAKLAGIPDTLIDKASQVLAGIEKNGLTDLSNTENFQNLPHNIQRTPPAKKRKQKTKKNGYNSGYNNDQMELFTDHSNPIKTVLKEVDISGMTPLDALNFLNELKKKSG